MIIYILILGGVAFLLSGFYYLFGRKFIDRWQRILLIFLRGVALWLLLILLINPQTKQKTILIQKPRLVVLVDDSESIDYLKQSTRVRSIVDSIRQSEALKKKYELQFYSFSENVRVLDSLKFEGRSSDIYKAITSLKTINKYLEVSTSVVMITDGNQTVGRDYEYFKDGAMPVYTLCVGDTLENLDVRVTQVNTNKYVFVNNKTPVEVLINYKGTVPVSTRLNILEEGKVVFKTDVSLSSSQNFATINASIIPKVIGRHVYRVELEPIEAEKNIQNNSQAFALEVIDQKTKVLIVSDIVHPDVGVMRRALSTDLQRQVRVASSQQARTLVKDQDAVILYQPKSTFEAVFEALHEYHKNYFVVAGPQTDWNFLNSVQHLVSGTITSNVIENVQSFPNLSYPDFPLEDIGFVDFPEVQRSFLSFRFAVQPHVLLYKGIESIRTQEPLLITLEQDKQRFAYLFSEGIWKWRMQSFVDKHGFGAFDNFIGRLVFYLSSHMSKQRLTPTYEPFYYQGSESAIFKASYFDKNFELYMAAQLVLVLENEEGQRQELPMIARQNYYEADLSRLHEGKYNFVLRELGTNTSIEGNFGIIAFNQEVQEDTANFRKLKILSKNTKGKQFDSARDIISKFVSEKTKSVQKIGTKKESLIEWGYLLIVAVVFFACEWFMRKYLGLI